MGPAPNEIHHHAFFATFLGKDAFVAVAVHVHPCWTNKLANMCVFLAPDQGHAGSAGERKRVTGDSAFLERS